MVATEFSTPQREPWTEWAKAAVKGAFDRGLLLLTCGSHDNTIRWIPPLIVDEAQIKAALDMFAEGMPA